MTIDRSGSLLSLEEFRAHFGYNPWHFWGLANSIAEVTSNCNDVVTQYPWQAADACGRADILEAIQTAEDKLRAYLGFSIAPQWEEDELQFPPFYDVKRTYLSSADAQGRWLGIRVKHGKVHDVGKMARTLIGNATATLSDVDGDTLSETFTLSIATSVTDPAEIAIYFGTTDRFDGSDVAERWRVPVDRVSITGGTATITGKSWTIVKPLLYEGAEADTLDPSDVASFASTLAVYRLYTDTTDQGSFLWETIPGQCCSDSSDPANVGIQTARYVIRNSELGVVAGEAATYDTDASAYVANGWGPGYAPERARVNYLAGWRLENGRMASRMRAIVARMAAAELSRPICACDKANRELYRWQFDESRAAGANDEQYSISQKDLENPFGQTRGQIWAWRQVQREALADAVIA